MVRDTCVKFDARSEKDKLRILPLSATICVGEAAQIAIWLNGVVDDPPIDIEPLRRILAYAAPVWSLAGMAQLPFSIHFKLLKVVCRSLFARS